MSKTLVDFESRRLIVVAKISTCWLDNNGRPIRWRWKRVHRTSGTILELVVLWLAVIIGKPNTPCPAPEPRPFHRAAD